ncbi:L,D-transpeptidase family protein [Paracoccus benzoatiresistens]|uniref:L,D-transpeptidase family protein n=1 Tax=Paracoccus benzoatiresistens TaxID=2997341 RepID=A0ABT4J3K8_9RHOB|nr:L,D-transpeptidase family protein [Paracoccus sp. EF6]MCZ0961725.1 L,D-transpeptidase family protein [Paracoccus sp. EF6]
MARSVGVAAAPRLDFSAAEMALAQAAAANPDLAAYYGTHGLKPVFLGPQGAARRAALLGAVALGPSHGIPAGRYAAEALAKDATDVATEVGQARILARYLRDMTGGIVRPARVDSLIKREVRRPPIDRLIHDFTQAPDPQRFLLDLQPRHPAYLALQDALAGGKSLGVPAHLPRIPEAMWRIGARGEGVLSLRARLDSIGFTAPAADPKVYDAGLADAVARYQAAAGLPSDGVAGPKTIRHLNGDVPDDSRSRAIVVALERMRWMAGEDLSARHVWVNIPEYTARIMDGGAEVFRTRTVVGSTDHDRQTPEFSDEMEYVVANPRWNVPRSITVKEYLPKLQANRHAVSHIDVVDGNGNVISRDRIDFGRYTAANFPYRMRQKASGDNALGLVKFIFPNPWNIYLHDTPTKHLFGNAARAYSHGCIRIGDPFDLAHALLSVQAKDPQAMFQRALDRGKETWLKLTPPVPVHLVYFTAFPDADGTIRRFEDVYGRDALLYDAIQKAGLDS